MKNKTEIIRWPFLLMAMLMLTACPPDSETDYLSASVSSVTLDENGKGQVTISSNVSWNVINLPDWISCSAMNGKGEMLLILTAGANPSTESRQGTLTVKSTVDTNLFTSVNIIQSGTPKTVHYIYGNPARTDQPPFTLESGDATGGRFSDNEGRYLPSLTDEVYFGLKTLIFEITAATAGPHIWGYGDDVGTTMRVMNGWWSDCYADNVVPKVGLWNLQITQKIADDCAQGGGGKDLDLLMTRGTITIKSVYYEE